jgi:two-component system, LuxR family, response regulator FixJ
MNRGHIYLIDNDPGRRLDLAGALKEHGYGLSAFEHVPGFLDGIDYDRLPDAACILTHLRLTPMSGVELLDVLRADRVALPAVLIGTAAERQLAVKAMRYGGTFILWRPFPASLLHEVIASVLTEWSETPAPRAPDSDRSAMRAFEDRLTSLSLRQRQVLRRVFEGSANRDIAADLGISVKTVELHRSEMMKKMHADSVASLIRMMSDYRHSLERCQ